MAFHGLRLVHKVGMYDEIDVIDVVDIVDVVDCTKLSMRKKRLVVWKYGMEVVKVVVNVEVVKQVED